MSYETELKTKFPIQFESNHVIGKDQLMISILKKASKGRKFNFSYKDGDIKLIASDLGHTILEV